MSFRYRNRIRFLSAALSAVLTLSLSGGYAEAAVTPEEPYGYSVEADVSDEPEKGLAGASNNLQTLSLSRYRASLLHDYADQHRASAVKNASSGTYYGFLNADEKKIYDQAAKLPSMPRLNSNLSIDTISESQVRDCLAKGTMVAAATSIKDADESATAFEEALFAYQFDHPTELCMTLCYVIGYRVKEGNGYTLYFGMQEVAKHDYSKMKQTLLSARDAAVKEIKENAYYRDNNAVKELLVHDYLTKKVTYEYDATEGSDKHMATHVAHTAYGGLVNRKAVCDGIALSACMLMDSLGVEGYVVCSEEHAWNIVKLDGDYYEMDITFEINRRETTGKVGHVYFNLPSAKMKTADKSGYHIRNGFSKRMPVATGTKYTYEYVRSLTGNSQSSNPGTGTDPGTGTNPGTGTDPGTGTTTEPEKEDPPYITGVRTISGKIYQLKADGTATCSGIVTIDASIRIPKQIVYKGFRYNVTAISDKAFKKQSKATYLLLSSNVERIGKKAFLKCSKLKNIRINNADKLKEVGAKAFKGINSDAQFYISGSNSGYKELVKKLKSAGADKAYYSRSAN